MLEWILDATIGKIDRDELYDGMRDRDRRSIDKRRAHLRQKAWEYARLFREKLEVSSQKKAESITFDEEKIEVYKYAILNNLYEDGSRLTSKFDSLSEKEVIRKILNCLGPDFDIASQAWGTAVLRASEDKALRVHLPSLFDGGDREIWNAIVKDRLAEEERRRLAAEKQRQQEKERHERREQLNKAISACESQISSLKSMFRGMNSGLDRSQVVVAIDSAEGYLSRLKEERRRLG